MGKYDLLFGFAVGFFITLLFGLLFLGATEIINEEKTYCDCELDAYSVDKMVVCDNQQLCYYTYKGFNPCNISGVEK